MSNKVRIAKKSSKTVRKTTGTVSHTDRDYLNKDRSLHSVSTFETELHRIYELNETRKNDSQLYKKILMFIFKWNHRREYVNVHLKLINMLYDMIQDGRANPDRIYCLSFQIYLASFENETYSKLESSIDMKVILSQILELTMPISTTSNRFSRTLISLIGKIPDNDVYDAVLEIVKDSMDEDDVVILLTEAIKVGNNDHYNRFKTLIKTMSLSMSAKTDLVIRSFYARKYVFCLALLQDLDSSQLTLIRSQIPDLDLIRNANSDTSSLSKIKCQESKSIRTLNELRTIFAIYQSTDSFTTNPNQLYQIFVMALEFDTSPFARTVYDEKPEYIDSRLEELFIHLIDSRDYPRLRCLLGMKKEKVCLTSIYDFKSDKLSSFQIKTINPSVLNISKDFGIIDQKWLSKMYRHYRRTLRQDHPDKLIVLCDFIKIEYEEQIIKFERRMKDRDHTYILYRIIKDTESLEEGFVLYYLSTQSVDVKIFNRILMRTAIHKGHHAVANLLS